MTRIKTRLFPSGIAEGSAFCNRTAERELLKQYIDNIQHTVIMAPRRYGKSSLITQVIRDNQLIYAWVDFLSVTTQEEIENKIRAAAKELVLAMSPEIKKIQVQTVDKIKSMSPELNLSAMGQSLKLQLSSDDTTPIDQILTELDKYAQKMEKTAVLVFDEFQQISEIEENKSVEALIRHAVERSKAVTYLFSGSNRHLLQEMFSQKDRPLYRLCSVMPLERIHPDEYLKFISRAASSRWGEALPKNLILKILDLTECHSFYVNALCNELWLKEKTPKNEGAIEQIWKTYMIKNKSIIVSEIVALPLNQKKIIKALSNSPEAEPYGIQFSTQTKIPSASIRRAIESLLLKDIIFQDANDCYRVLDPAVSYYFRCLH